MKKRSILINTLIENYGYESYLEVGSGSPANNFDYIDVSLKESVDPKHDATYRMTSDHFFETNDKTYDIIFIDGSHICDQVLKDINNSLKILNEGGIIVLHDSNPKSEKEQQIPRAQTRFTGDVWKAFVYLRMTREDLTMETVDIETGCSLIYPGYQQLIDNQEDLTYSDLVENRDYWLNIITYNEFLNSYK